MADLLSSITKLNYKSLILPLFHYRSFVPFWNTYFESETLMKYKPFFGYCMKEKCCWLILWVIVALRRNFCCFLSCGRLKMKVNDRHNLHNTRKRCFWNRNFASFCSCEKVRKEKHRSNKSWARFESLFWSDMRCWSHQSYFLDSKKSWLFQWPILDAKQ